MSVSHLDLQAITDVVMRPTSNRQVEATSKSNVASSRQENVPNMSTSSPARATSKKTSVQSDTHTTLQKNDTKFVVEHADSAVLTVIAQSHAQTKETLDACRNSKGTLTASSGQHRETAQHIQASADVGETRVSLTRTS